MRSAAAACALLVLAACSRPAGSALRFEHERLDLGTLRQYGEQTFVLPFRVEGDAPVRIDSLEVSCGCTDVSLVVDGAVLLLAESAAHAGDAAQPTDEEPLTAHAGEREISLAAGVRGEVRGTYRPERRLNEQVVSIFLRGSMLNAPARAELRAMIEPVFVVEPNPVVFGTMVDSSLRAQAQTREVVVRGAAPFTLKGWQQVPEGLRIEDLGEVASDGSAAGRARRYRLTLDDRAPHGVVQQLVSAGTDLGADLQLVVAWRVVGPATYAPEQRVSFMQVPFGREHVRSVKVLPSLPEIVLPEPRAEILGEAGKLLRVRVEPLAAESGWLVRCTLPPETQPGAATGTLRISYPADAGLPTQELIVNLRVQEPR